MISGHGFAKGRSLRSPASLPFCPTPCPTQVGMWTQQLGVYVPENKGLS